jgi:hypothetical protein
MSSKEGTVGLPRNSGSILRSKGFFFLPKCPDWLWDPPNLLFNGYKGISPAVRRSGREADEKYVNKIIIMIIIIIDLMCSMSVHYIIQKH